MSDSSNVIYHVAEFVFKATKHRRRAKAKSEKACAVNINIKTTGTIPERF